MMTQEVFTLDNKMYNEQSHRQKPLRRIEIAYVKL